MVLQTLVGLKNGVGLFIMVWACVYLQSDVGLCGLAEWCGLQYMCGFADCCVFEEWSGALQTDIACVYLQFDVGLCGLAPLCGLV